MASATALVPYDVDFARRDEPGYSNYAVTESYSNYSDPAYSVSASSSQDSEDYYYSNSPTSIVASPQQQMVPYNNNSVNPKHPRKVQMKRQRRRRTAGGAVGGAVFGGLVLGPVGAVFGGVGGAALTRKICRTGEKKATRKFEHQLMQQHALEAGARSNGSFA